MEKLIELIKNNRKIAIGSVIAILILILAAIIILSLHEGSNDEKDERQGYFSSNGQPVYVTENDGKLVLEIEGYDVSGLKWGINPELSSMFETINDTSSDGKLTSEITPLSEGYGNMTYSQVGEIGSLSYEAVNVVAEVVISSDDNGKLICSLSDIHEQLAKAGALDTDTPYILQENKVMLPNKGDWVLTAINSAEESNAQTTTTQPSTTQAATEDIKYDENKPTITEEYEEESGLYHIYTGTNDDGFFYYGVTVDTSFIDLSDTSDTDSESKLILKNEQLEIEKQLQCTMGEDGNWTLSEVSE